MIKRGWLPVPEGVETTVRIIATEAMQPQTIWRTNDPWDLWRWGWWGRDLSRDSDTPRFRAVPVVTILPDRFWA